MLGIMRKNAGSWIVKLLLGGLALIFAVSFGASSFMSDSGTVLKVNGQEISEQQVREEMDDFFTLYSRQLGPEFARQISTQQLRAMAQQRLLQLALLGQAAGRLGIATLPEELRQHIESDARFQQNGGFSFDLYRDRLRAMGMNPEQYEAALQQELTILKLRTMLNSGVFVTEDELAQYINNVLTRVEGAYVLFRARDYAGQVNVTPEEIQNYYDSHKNDYVEPAKIRFAYLRFTREHFTPGITVTEDQIHQAYASNMERFIKPEQLLVRSILLQVPPRADAEMRQQLKLKAEAVLQQANTEGRDFVDLAKRHDQNPAGRQGEVWPIKREDMAPQMAGQLFATLPGQTALLETPDGFMIIKVEDHQPAQVTPIDDVREQLVREIKERSAGVAASQAASQALAEIHRGQTLAEVAEASGLKVEESALITINDDLPGLAPTREIWDALAGLKPGQAGVPLNFEGGVLLPVLLEQVTAASKPLEEVEQQVRDTLVNAKALSLAMEAAQGKIDELKAAPDPVEKMLAQKGVVRIGPLLPDEEISDLPGSDALNEALFGQAAGMPVIDAPLPVLDGIAVAVLLNRIAPDAQEVEQARDQQRAALLEQKQAAVFQMYLQDLLAQATIEGGQ